MAKVIKNCKLFNYDCYAEVSIDISHPDHTLCGFVAWGGYYKKVSVSTDNKESAMRELLHQLGLAFETLILEEKAQRKRYSK